MRNLASWWALKVAKRALCTDTSKARCLRAAEEVEDLCPGDWYTPGIPPHWRKRPGGSAGWTWRDLNDPQPTPAALADIVPLKPSSRSGAPMNEVTRILDAIGQG